MALASVLSGLPAGFPAIVLVAQHRAADFPDTFADFLAHRTHLKTKLAEQDETPRPGTIYVAPAGRHLVLGKQGALSVRRSERVRFVRPSADLLFQSAATRYRSRALGVILTGSGGDGAAGIRAIRRRAGFTIAQDESSSAFFDMPEAAIGTGHVDVVLPLRRIAFAITLLVMGQEAAIALHPPVGPVGRCSRLCKVT